MLVELIPSVIMCPKGEPRSPGTHVSNIIRNIAVANGVLDPKWVEDFSLIEVQGEESEWWGSLDRGSQIRMSIGMAWEAWYLGHLAHIAFKPGEMKVDGIYMTHDGESLDTIVTAKTKITEYVLCLHEVKTTSKSTKTVGNLETQWMWLAQTKAYCKGLNTCRAFLHVLFLCGDYKYPITPQLKVFQITYTQAEIDDNWELMVSYMHHHQQQENEDVMRDTE